MSHFTVTVRLTAERLARPLGDVSDALGEIMAPYCENIEDERFLEFDDEEDEMRSDYESGTTERVRMPDGSLAPPWDERFRVPGRIGFGSDTHKVPDGLERVQVSFKDIYPTFEEWVRDWSGHNGPDEKTGRYGYWRNPNGKWDWWVVGGRWTGFYPLKPGAEVRLGESGAFGNKPEPGHGDIVRVSEIDFDAVRAKQQERATKFFREYLEFLDGKRFPTFEGPRSRAIDMGLVRVEREPVVAKPGERIFSWEHYVQPGDERRHWSDVLTEIDEATFFREHLEDFNPISTYAGLDNDGWVEPGRMGWFGCSDATPESRKEWKRAFHERFIAAAGPDDLLVVVDCHI